MNEGFKKGGTIGYLSEKIVINQNLTSEIQIKELLAVLLMKVQLMQFSQDQILTSLKQIEEYVTREKQNFGKFMKHI